jgi:hypothetical protein
MVRILSLTLTALLLGACSTGDGGDDAAATERETVVDPAGAIVGAWIWRNEVGSFRYSFAADGTVRITSENRYQRLDFAGSWSIVGDDVVVRLEDDEGGDSEERVRFLGPDRISIRSDLDDEETIYERSR